jgi:hypothetical protein
MTIKGRDCRMLGFKEFVYLPVLQQILISSDQSTFQLLDEGKWVQGRFDGNIRIDKPTHGVGQTHAHVYGRNGEKIGVVNLDGSSSHGTKCRLSDADADALRNIGFKIPTGNIVEWLELPTQPEMLFG